MRDQPSTANVPVFRELNGNEAATIFAHDLEEAVIDLLASGEFRKKALDLFEKTGRFGAGAAYPVVVMVANMRIKVYTSIEAARSKEAMPPARSHLLEIQTGELRPDSEEVITQDTQISRVIGTDISNAVDKARKEVGITPLIPKRDGQGIVVNSPDEHEARKADYADRLTKTRAKRSILKTPEEMAAKRERKENREREKLANDAPAAQNPSPVGGSAEVPRS